MRRHKVKMERRDAKHCAIMMAREDELSRVEKIGMLNRCGYSVSRKANSQRVERVLEKAHSEARREQERAEALRVARNMRRNLRRKRSV